MRKIRVVHHGVAHDHSPMTMECAKAHPDVFEIVGIVEPDEAMWQEYGSNEAYAGVPRMTEEELFARDDIDAVFVEGHELRSVSDAQKCIDHGLHVHLDKPGGVDLAAFERLLNSAEEKGLTLQMAYMYRWNPAMKYAIDAVKSGRLGTITAIDGTFSMLHDEKKRRWLGQFPGGMMFYIGCHVVDMIMLLNGMPTAVHAYNRSSGFENDGSMDNGFAVLDYPNGVCTVRANATEVNGYARRQLMIAGTNGSILIQPLECPTLVRETMYGDGPMNNKGSDQSRSVFPGYLIGRYDDMMLEFAACVRGEMKNPYTKEYELALQKVVMQTCGMDV